MKNIIKGLSESKRREVVEVFNRAFEEIYQSGYADGQAASSTAEDTAVETIEHEGLLLRKVDRKALEGDYIRPNQQIDGHLLKDGEIYGPVKFIDGNLVVGSGPYNLYAKGHNRKLETVEVFEVVTQEMDKRAPLTAHQQRAEVVKRAREFVEKFQAVRDGDETHVEGNTTALEHWYETDFFVKERKVAAVVYHLEFGKKRVKRSSHVGRAICAPNDVFNEWIGKAIALAKALEIGIPQEFLDAVQPDEKVVGMIIDTKANGIRVLVNDDNLVIPHKKCHLNSLYGKSGTIIDDTDAEYEVG